MPTATNNYFTAVVTFRGVWSRYVTHWFNQSRRSVKQLRAASPPTTTTLKLCSRSSNKDPVMNYVTRGAFCSVMDYCWNFIHICVWLLVSLVGLSAGSRKNHRADIHKTWMEDGYRSRTDPVNFQWERYGSRYVFSTSLTSTYAQDVGGWWFWLSIKGACWALAEVYALLLQSSLYVNLKL